MMDELEQGKTLFRQEVIAARQSHWLGPTSIRAPQLGLVMAIASVFMIGAVLALLVFGRYTRREHAIGYLLPSGGLATLVPAMPGTIEIITVNEGAHVVKGQEILVVSSDQDTGDAGSVRAAIASDLLAKQRQLESDQRNQVAAASVQEDVLSAQLKALVARQAEVAGQLTLQQQRADGAEDILEQWTIANRKGVVTRLQVLQQKDSLLQSQLAVGQLRAQALELRQQIEEVRGKIGAVKATLAMSLSQATQSLADVSQAMTENAATHRMVLRAPFDGVVSSLSVHTGQAVLQGQVLASIAPSGRELMGELWMLGSSLSRMKPGQVVTMRYAAARAGLEGSIHGVVAQIAGSATDASRVQKLLGREVDGSRYRVTVSLTTSLRELNQMGLRPGMELDAEVLIERRRLFEWVIDPLYGRSSGLSLHSGAGIEAAR